MFKRVLFGLFFLIAGALLASALLVNPFGWSWLESAQHQLQALIQPSHEHSESMEGQLWTCGMHPQVIQDERGDCPICGMALTPLKNSGPGQPGEDQPEKEKKIKYWVAPMDPTYISDQPGKSPMGMDLVPVYEEDQEPEGETVGVVHIDPAFVQNIGVQSTEVERQDIAFTIRTIGTVSYSDERVYMVNTKYAGWVEDVQANYVGEPVTKGQKLFEIYSPDLVTTQKEYLNALDYAERLSSGDYPEIKERALSLLNASRERLQYWDITEGQIRELEKSRQTKRTLTVFAPVSGLVLGKMEQTLEGMYVKPGMNLYKIVDLSTVWVEAEVFEHQIPWLKLGQRAELEFTYQPGRKFRGEIRYVYPFFNQKTRTMKVSIELPNPDLALKADMYANVTFNVPSARNVLTVPENAVIHSGERDVVVLDKGEGMFQVKEVVLGVNGENVWEVKKGIEAGDKVVTSSQFLIDSESNLREAIQKMMAARKRESQPQPMPDETSEMSETTQPVEGAHDH
jgi:Cu(I)/Ag(I) efflux system membrane fusion protein/cobalt-zinc-cadmium efflux system membrane fusion protein